MPRLIAVEWAPEEEPPEPQKDVYALVAALGDETIEGLHEAAMQNMRLIRLLNCYLRRQHGVSIARIGADEHGVLTIVVEEKLPAPRLCRWDKKLWTLSKTIEWALMYRKATLRWTIHFWERDFES